MPDKKQEEQLKSEQAEKAQQKNENGNQTPQRDAFTKKEEKRKSEQDQEAQRKNEEDKKEQERQDLIKKEEAAESQRTRCKICKREVAPVRRCFGHDSGGSGGGDSIGGGGSEEKLDGSAPTTLVDKVINMIGQVAHAISQAIDGNIAQQPHQFDEPMFNSEIISEMLSKKLLLIENDRDSGILTIKQCNPNLLSEEQRKELKKFVDTLLKELDEFKKEKGISANCAVIEKDSEGNFLSLRITLQKPAVYDAFIQRLSSKNLLPMQVIGQQEKKQPVYQESMNYFSPTPLSTKLTHNMNKKAKPTDETQHQAEKQDISKKEEKSSVVVQT